MKFLSQNCNAYFLTGTIPCFLQLLFIIPENCDRIMYDFKRNHKKAHENL